MRTLDDSPGEEILRIPAECWLSHRSVLKASGAAHIIRDDDVVKRIVKEDVTWAVIIGLMYERTNEYSPWLPYMRFMRRQEVSWAHSEYASTCGRIDTVCENTRMMPLKESIHNIKANYHH